MFNNHTDFKSCIIIYLLIDLALVRQKLQKQHTNDRYITSYLHIRNSCCHNIGYKQCIAIYTRQNRQQYYRHFRSLLDLDSQFFLQFSYTATVQRLD